MSKDKLYQFLGNEKIISAPARQEVVDRFKHKALSKNQFQLTSGRVCDEYLFLEEGYMRAFAFDTGGNEVTTNFYAAGEVIFEVSSFFNRSRSQENIQTLTDCEGWFITYKELNELFHSLPEFREFGRSVLVKGFAQLKTRMLNMITLTAEERYELLLATNPGIFQHAPLKHIASYLGITDTSLSRIRKDLSKK
ncbi:Crp/Fnr family transcriptional regulator [Mucilaginibacter sp.]|uniref:Crp/Fnr family transcriptional regulator n=1 Tax=Mucilaginibacter sp. TaxID=1882438 RepID=UPI0035BC3BB7